MYKEQRGRKKPLLRYRLVEIYSRVCSAALFPVQRSYTSICTLVQYTSVGIHGPVHQSAKIILKRKKKRTDEVKIKNTTLIDVACLTPLR